MTDISIPREVRPYEFRVALAPSGVHALTRAGHRVFIEHNAGLGSGFADEAYRQVGAQIVYSESLYLKLLNYFVRNAPLDIDPGTAMSPQITQEMLSGETFYISGETDDGGHFYRKLVFHDGSDQQYDGHYRRVDSEGNTIEDHSWTDSSYDLEDGMIRVYYMFFWLNTQPGDGDWDMRIASDHVSSVMWYVTAPDGFPSDM